MQVNKHGTPAAQSSVVCVAGGSMWLMHGGGTGAGFGLECCRRSSGILESGPVCETRTTAISRRTSSHLLLSRVGRGAASPLLAENMVLRKVASTLQRQSTRKKPPS